MLDPIVSIKYMLAGYAVVLVIIPAYLVSLLLRWRTQKRNLRDLEEMKAKE
jgi:hypothetical protein